MKKNISIKEAAKAIIKVETEQTGLNPDYVFGFMDAILTLFDINQEEMDKLRGQVAKKKVDVVEEMDRFEREEILGTSFLAKRPPLENGLRKDER